MRPRSAVLALVAPLFLVTACGGDDSRSEPPDPGAPVSRAPSTETTTAD